MEKLIVGSSSVGELIVEARNLLLVTYKNVIGSLHAAWHIMSSIEQKEEGCKNEEHVGSKVDFELVGVCAIILKLLEAHLIPFASISESKVFYLKMKGDYYRYFVEFNVGAKRKESAGYDAGLLSGSGIISLPILCKFDWIFHVLCNGQQFIDTRIIEIEKEIKIPTRFLKPIGIFMKG
ncbi:hypothetical protein NE237_019779 [Protea cynaroides]|uniref:14-3-3 domain-containing protein n=1 Tax=Protea cynaroides TaxID=273540 RepID=A0A9Q0K111_9MAGN|nr:hypothetical protein NE237_019779 [Protea cynaroides]